jgi:Zn-dependent protease
MWSLAGYTLPESATGHPWPAYWAVGLASALGVVASILAHELSHAVIARHHGSAVQDITLWMFGGVARLGAQAGNPTTELEIAVAGPATSVAIGATCLVLTVIGAGADAPDLLTIALAWLGAINVVLAVFNLLPGAPPRWGTGTDGDPVETLG